MKLHRLTAQLVVGAMLTLPVWAHAAGLGRLTVKSALGQPLSAEIELLADKSELDSLTASLASGQAYRDARIEFAPVLSSVQFNIEKRPDGRAVLKLTSTKPIHEPFLDMLIELNWATGRLLREYTVLLDPPGIAVPQTVAPIAVSVPEIKPDQPAMQVVPGPERTNQFATEVVAAPTAEKPADQPAVTTVRVDQPVPALVGAQSLAVGQETYVQVKRGDTLTGIANRVRPATVSLEQALVGLFRENPAAFVGGNMNRLKSGQRLKVPAAETLAAIDPQSARREVNLQAADWHAYRAKLAERVTEQPLESEAPGKTVVGRITPKVEDKAQPKIDAAKDVLKLSKAALPGSAEEKAAKEGVLAQQKAVAEEDRLAREKALEESAERVAILEKQIEDLQKLAKLQEKPAAAAAPQGEAKPPAAAAPKVKKALPPPVEEPQESWYDELLENPIYWTGGLAVVVLGGLLWWMMAGGRLRRKPAPETATDGISTGGELQTSGIAGAVATGGVVNTGDTSFLTDFSQAGLATIDTQDVDPIAEADVYMAYGRDAQAEEILKEALSKTPDRHEIRLKLLEIYAARKNVTAFETVAGELYAALGGETGAIWDKVIEMGRSIDPHNPLYGKTEQRTPAAEPVPMAMKPAAQAEGPFPAETKPFMQVEPKPAGEPELQAQSGTEAELAKAIDNVREFTPEPLAPVGEPSFPTLDEGIQAEAAPAGKKEQTLDFGLSGLDLDIPEAAPAADEVPKSPPIDFSGLDLDLTDMGAAEEFDEVATKLDLARAYLEMGDKEGAREILKEVINEGNDRQKSEAQRIMAGL